MDNRPRRPNGLASWEQFQVPNSMHQTIGVRTSRINVKKKKEMRKNQRESGKIEIGYDRIRLIFKSNGGPADFSGVVLLANGCHHHSQQQFSWEENL
jgi:hypothetical protein